MIVAQDAATPIDPKQQQRAEPMDEDDYGDGGLDDNMLADIDLDV